MSGPFGFKSDDEFRAAIDAELQARSVHDSGGHKPKQSQQPPEVKLAGKPGSRERMKQIARIAGQENQQLVQDVGRSLAGQELLKSVKKLQREGLSVEEVERAVAMSLELDRADVAQSVLYALPDDAADVYENLLAHGVQARNEARERATEKGEQSRLAQREALLQSEYARAQQFGDDVVDVLDNEVQALGPDVLYDPGLTDDVLRLGTRTTVEAARAASDAISSFSLHAQMDDEIRRGVGAPGSSWSDSEREKWQAELAAGSVEVYERKMGTPEQITARAVDSLRPDGFLGELDAELDRLSTPPAHQQALRDANVEHWEQTEGRRIRGE